jgi:hypothetical protein
MPCAGPSLIDVFIFCGGGDGTRRLARIIQKTSHVLMAKINKQTAKQGEDSFWTIPGFHLSVILCHYTTA